MDIAKAFENTARNLSGVISHIDETIDDLGGEPQGTDKKVFNKRFINRLSRLRKNREAVRFEIDNPEIQDVLDHLDDSLEF